MTIEELRQAKYRSPFRPFRIRMADRSEIRVSRAEHVACDEETWTVVCRSGRAGEVIDIDPITSLGDAPASPSPET